MTYSVVVKVSVSFVWNRGSLPIISDFFRSTIVGRKRMSHFSSKRQKKGVVFTIMQNSQNSKNFCFSSFASRHNVIVSLQIDVAWFGVTCTLF